MKKIILLSILVFLSCKNNSKVKNIQINEQITTINNDIYLGKKFYESDELSNFEYLLGGVLSKDSIFNYSIYEDEDMYIYSLEKLISYHDLREYLILDTLRLKKTEVSNLKSYSYPLTNDLKILNFKQNNLIETFFIDSTYSKIKK